MHSLKNKVITVVLLIAISISAITILVSYNVYSNTTFDHYKTLTMNLAKTGASMVDKNEVKKLTDTVMSIYRNQCDGNTPPDFDNFSESDYEEYYSNFNSPSNSKEFSSIFDTLYKIKNDNNVLWMYISYMDINTGKGVYIVDADVEGEANPCGTCDPIEEGNLELMKSGKNDFPAYITNYEEYGWLCSASAAIKDDDGNIIANAYVDISMDKVMADRQAFLIKLSLIVLGVLIIIIIVTIHLVNKGLVKPINSLSKATTQFVSSKKEGSSSEISKLNIKTKDEIERLAKSVMLMESDINKYITDLTSVTAEKERIGAELDIAKHIQASMLPCIFPAFPDRTEFDIFASMTPAKEVGGDFYDFFMVDDSHLAVVMADVSGKGVPAALFMVIGKTLIKDHTQIDRDLSEIFSEVNNILCESNSECLFITAFEGVLDLVTGEFRYVNAGHEKPFIAHKDSDYEIINIKSGFVLAGRKKMKFHSGVTSLVPGDRVFLYTDGVPEATRKDDELFGMTRLTETLSKYKDKSPNELLPAVKADVDAFVGDAPQFDDLTMLCFEYKEYMGGCKDEGDNS